MVEAPAPPRWLAPVVLVVAVLAVAGGAALGPMVGAAAVVAVGLGLLALHRPELAAVAAVVLAAPLSGLRRGLPVPGFRLSELLIVGAAAAVLVSARRGAARWGIVDVSLLAYVVLTLVLGMLGALRHGVHLGGDIVGTLVGPLQFLLLLRAARLGLRTWALRAQALRGVLWASLPVAALALAQQLIGGPVARALASATGSDSYSQNALYFASRATGPFPHWHVLGGYLLVVALLATALLLDRRQDVASRRLCWAAVAACVAGIVLTLTLAVIGGLLVGVVLVGSRSHQLRRVVRGVVLAGGAVVLISAPLLAARVSNQLSSAQASGGQLVPQTLTYRIDVWTHQYGPAVAGRWLTGYGPTLPPEVTWRYTESLYITLVLRGGLLLLLAALAFFLALYVAAAARTDDPDATRRAPARALVALVVVLVPMHAVFPYLVTTGLPHLLAAVAGVMLAGSSDPRGPTAPQPRGAKEARKALLAVGT